jgi:hypothetical protein
MKMIRIALLYTFLVLSTAMLAQNGAYQTFKFINMNPSAKALAMGGARVSQSDNDLNSTLLNPALLNNQNNQQASINYLNYIGDSHFGLFNYARQQKFGMLQASILYFSGGKFVQTDETSTITGSFRANETAFICSWSKQLDSVLSVGASVKYLHSALETYRSNGLAFDLGASYKHPNQQFTAGIVAKNIGFQMKTYAGNRANLPLDVQAGLSYRFEHVPFRVTLTAVQLNRYNLVYVDTSAANNIDPITNQVVAPDKRVFANIINHFVVGGEILLLKSFNIRAGFNFKRRDELKVDNYPSISGLSLGFGLKLKKMQINYGYARYHFYGNANSFSLIYELRKG